MAVSSYFFQYKPGLRGHGCNCGASPDYRVMAASVIIQEPDFERQIPGLCPFSSLVLIVSMYKLVDLHWLEMRNHYLLLFVHSLPTCSSCPHPLTTLKVWIARQCHISPHRQQVKVSLNNLGPNPNPTGINMKVPIDFSGFGIKLLQGCKLSGHSHCSRSRWLTPLGCPVLSWM